MLIPGNGPMRIMTAFASLCLAASCFADGWSSPLEIRFVSAINSGDIVEFESKTGTTTHNYTNYAKKFRVITGGVSESDDINRMLSILLTARTTGNAIQAYVKDTGGTDSKPNDIFEIVMCDGGDCPNPY